MSKKFYLREKQQNKIDLGPKFDLIPPLRSRIIRLVIIAIVTSVAIAISRNFPLCLTGGIAVALALEWQIATLENKTKYAQELKQEFKGVIANLNTQLEREKNGNAQKIYLYQQELETIKLQLDAAESQENNHLLSAGELKKLFKLYRQREEEIKSLQELAGWREKKIELLIEDLRLAKEEVNQDGHQLKQKLSEAQYQTAIIESTLNRLLQAEFEHLVSKKLKCSDRLPENRWKVLKKFDVSDDRDRYSSYADFVVINTDCVVVVAAKGYQGKIEIEGKFDKNEWWCYYPHSNKPWLVEGGGEINPYQQVSDYAVKLYHRIKAFKFTTKPGPSGWKGLYTYRVIVFPETTQIGGITGKLVTEVYDGYYRIDEQSRGITIITNIERLEEALEEIEVHAKPRITGKIKLSLEQIEDGLHGRIIQI
jgi:Nuclease-related domain